MPATTTMNSRIFYRVVSIVAVTSCLLLAAAIRFWPNPFCDAATRVTERDFDSNQARIAFVQEFVPATIPADATDIRIEYVSWLDWSLDASLRLTEGSAEEFIVAMEPFAGVYRMPDKGVRGDIRVDAAKNLVMIHCTNDK